MSRKLLWLLRPCHKITECGKNAIECWENYIYDLILHDNGILGFVYNYEYILE